MGTGGGRDCSRGGGRGEEGIWTLTRLTTRFASAEVFSAISSTVGNKGGVAWSASV